MSRYFAPITEEELRKKIWEAIQKNRDFEDEGEPPHGFGYNYLQLFKFLTPAIEKDLNKVEFDTENVIGPQDRNKDEMPPHGFYSLPNGLVFWGMSAGGDWESPVYWITYWDGSKLRAYIPTEGNLWNTSTKAAYGNQDEEEDAKNAVKRFPYLKENLENGVYVLDGLEYDWDAMRKDIEARILPVASKPEIKEPAKKEKVVTDVQQEKIRVYAQALKEVRHSLNTYFAEEESERLVALIDKAFERVKQYDKK